MIHRLRCVDAVAAASCVAFLGDKGIKGACVDPRNTAVVQVENLTPLTVMFLAEDALTHGWAHDDDCARMIADLG